MPSKEQGEESLGAQLCKRDPVSYLVGERAAGYPLARLQRTFIHASVFDPERFVVQVGKPE